MTHPTVSHNFDVSPDVQNTFSQVLNPAAVLEVLQRVQREEQHAEESGGGGGAGGVQFRKQLETLLPKGDSVQGVMRSPEFANVIFVFYIMPPFFFPHALCNTLQHIANRLSESCAQQSHTIAWIFKFEFGFCYVCRLCATRCNALQHAATYCKHVVRGLSATCNEAHEVLG